VELNAILYRYELNMADFQSFMLENGFINTASIQGSGAESTGGTIISSGYNISHSVEYYKEAAFNRSVAMKQVLWNETLYAWQDFNLTSGRLNADNITSISSYIPIWAGLMDGQSVTVRTKIFNSFLNSGLHQSGGILTKTFYSGQQWDAPNSWPPLVWFTIEGLVKLKLPLSVQLAVCYN
jgi:neutral trehalase